MNKVSLASTALALAAAAAFSLAPMTVSAAQSKMVKCYNVCKDHDCNGKHYKKMSKKACKKAGGTMHHNHGKKHHGKKHHAKKHHSNSKMNNDGQMSSGQGSNAPATPTTQPQQGGQM